MEEFRKELDELMGKDRNLPLAERAKKRDHFDDADVCRYFLVGVCPHDLFINTRSDMGRCKKRHDNTFKKQFMSDPNRQYYQKNLARIETPMPDNDRSQDAQDKNNTINALIDRKLKEVEQLAEAGRVMESEQLIKEIEQLKEQRESQESIVCEICGAMQSSTDTDRRQISHLEGKQHQGFAKIRKCIEEIRSHRDMYRHIDLSKPPPKFPGEEGELSPKPPEKPEIPKPTNPRPSGNYDRGQGYNRPQDYGNRSYQGGYSRGGGYDRGAGRGYDREGYSRPAENYGRERQEGYSRGTERPQDNRERPQEARPQEAKPQEAKPQETRPQETRPQEARPQETRPQETRPQEARDRPADGYSRGERPSSYGSDQRYRNPQYDSDRYARSGPPRSDEQPHERRSRSPRRRH